MKYAKAINQLQRAVVCLPSSEILPPGVEEMMKHIARCLGAAEGWLSGFSTVRSELPEPRFDHQAYLRSLLSHEPIPPGQFCPVCHRSSRKVTKRIQTRK